MVQLHGDAAVSKLVTASCKAQAHAGVKHGPFELEPKTDDRHEHSEVCSRQLAANLGRLAFCMVYMWLAFANPSLTQLRCALHNAPFIAECTTTRNTQRASTGAHSWTQACTSSSWCYNRYTAPACSMRGDKVHLVNMLQS
jgi:hypothetical protein